jgi:hypothetical protein
MPDLIGMHGESCEQRMPARLLSGFSRNWTRPAGSRWTPRTVVYFCAIRSNDLVNGIVAHVDDAALHGGYTVGIAKVDSAQRGAKVTRHVRRLQLSGVGAQQDVFTLEGATFSLTLSLAQASCLLT